MSLTMARQIEGLDAEPAPAGVGQHLAAQAGGTPARHVDLLQEGADRGLGRHVLTGQLRVTLDYREQVVEVVRDAARQHGQALQLLRLVQPALDLDPVQVGAPQPQVRLDVRQQFLDLERLADVIDAADLEGTHDVRRLIAGGQEDDGNVGGPRLRLELLADRVAIQVGQHQIEQHQVRGFGTDGFQTHGPSRGSTDLVTVLP